MGVKCGCNMFWGAMPVATLIARVKDAGRDFTNNADQCTKNY